MDKSSKTVRYDSSFKVSRKNKFALVALSLSGALMTTLPAAAELVRIEAIGKIDFVNAALGNAFSRGQMGRMILTYDTDAADTNSSATVGSYPSGAIETFQIFDKDYNPYFTFANEPGGTITVTNDGEKDSITLEAYTAARLNENPDDGLRGPSRNSLKLLGGFFGALDSSENIFENDKLPPADDEESLEWPGTAFYFALQYCSGCRDGNGFGRGVNFKITQAQATTLEDKLLTLKPNGNELIATGTLDATALGTLAKAQKNYPDKKNLVLQYMPGSDDDEANVVLGVKIRKAGYNTRVPSDGMIASGGVDMFLAGNARILDKGACVGVHSWSGDGVEGKDVPKSDPRHALYLKYFKDIDIPEALYWFTLEKAPAGGMYFMSQGEVNRFGMTTAPAPVLGTQADCDGR